MAFDSNQTDAVNRLVPLVPFLATGRQQFAGDLVRKSAKRQLTSSQFFWIEKLTAIALKRRADGVTPETPDTDADKSDKADKSSASSTGVDHAEVKRIVRSVLQSEGPTPAVMQDIAKTVLDTHLAVSVKAAQQGLDAKIANLVAAEVAKVAAKVVKIEVHKDGKAKVLEGHHHPKFSLLLRVCSTRQANGSPINVWVAGPAASGKTTAAHNVAKALDIPFHFNGAVSMAHELLGFVDAGGRYHRTAFREAFEKGGVYLFDEVDGSDNSPLLALNAALANDIMTFPDGQVKRHKDCIVIACANTWGLGATADYVGRAKIDAAFLSRFPVRILWDYDADLELKISGNVEFTRRVQKAREAARRSGLKVLICPRMSMAGSALVNAGFTSDEAADATFLANLNADQRRMIA